MTGNRILTGWPDMQTKNRQRPSSSNRKHADSRATPRGAGACARGGGARGTLLAVLLLTAAGCTTGEPYMRDPRRLVIHSGERLAPTRERMLEIDEWATEQTDSIRDDPSFWIISSVHDGPAYPWETLEVTAAGDTAFIGHQRQDIRDPYLIYAHLHLMAAQDRLDRWLPEADGGTDFEIERAIMSRVSDTWLYLRSIHDARPYDLLEELVYSAENGYLDAYILVARPDEFVDARRQWLAEDADARDAFIAWFRETFERDPPGVRGSGGER